MSLRNRGYNSLWLLVLIFVIPLLGCSTLDGVREPEYFLPYWSPGVSSMEKRFQLAQRTDPELILFLKAMPKGADLHNHLSGATYSDYILDSARDAGLNYNLESNLFVSDGLLEGIVVSIDELEGTSAYLAQFKNIYSMRGWYKNTTNGHDHFFDTFSYMSSGGRTGDDMLVEVLERNRYENVQYLELMVQSVPGEIRAHFSNLAGFSFDPENMDSAYRLLNEKYREIDFAGKLAEALDERERYLVSRGIRLGEDIDVRYILQLKRATSSLSGFFIDTYVYMRACHLDPRIVAVNMVQAEDTPASRRNFDNQMKILDYLWNKLEKPRMTLHAGELVLNGSPVESMRNRIKDTIKFGHAERIGHGVSVAWEESGRELLDTMRKNGITVEICLSSNESILGVEGRAHPLMLYLRSGVPVVLCTDDEGVSRGNLTMEYLKAVRRYNFTYTELKNLVRNSIEYSFIGGQSLYPDGDYRAVRPGFESVRAMDWQPDERQRLLMDENPRLKQQVLLERAFIKFENGF